MLLDKSFAMKLAYYPTLGLDFQTASKIAKYSAHLHFITKLPTKIKAPLF